MRDAILDLSVAQLASLIRSRDISSVEATEVCLSAISEQNSGLGCFISIEAEDARRTARTADPARSKSAALGPLHGVPLAHKDMFYRAGKVCTGGSFIRRDFVPETTSTAIERLDRSGAVTIGTLHMSEFAAWPTGHNRHFPQCRNPWNRNYITGGSSSGSACAVAARLVFGSLGSDTGGSIRVPASICGVVGIKPTNSLVSRHGTVTRSWSLDCIGPLARTVEDCAMLLQAIAGFDPRDASSSNIPVDDYLAGIDDGIKDLKIGVPTDYLYPNTDEAVTPVLEAALDVFRSIGARVVPIPTVDPSLGYKLQDVVGKVESATIHGPWIRERPEDYNFFVRSRIEAGFYVPATRYVEALTLRKALLREFMETVFNKVEVLFLPVLLISVPTIAESETKNVAAMSRIISRMTECTRGTNYLGLPALSVPCGFSANGLPVAFQVLARPFAEAVLFRVGHAYQSVTDWHVQAPRFAGTAP